ncbi:unnamed protein product [Brassica rapa]|uniref:Uncharacterized protein n=2 Tax=Brassica TaxID=3705 RepID=A0A3P5Y948_BRACM|nr:unnamed protein product [Brassica napus]CAG7866926.1 unnamed protein product [Brassica rapa]CDY53307.1 BnaA09g56640D [Brassica napus]VDC63889.1 unnamed protein product [Brassica rapa]
MTRNHVGFARAGENGMYTKHTYTDSDLIALKALEKENSKYHELQRNMHLKRMQEWNLLLEIIPYQQGMITFFTFKL